MKKYKGIVISLLLALILSGCANAATQPNNEFDNFINEEFIKSASSDSITTHYLLENPEKYNIKEEKLSIGSYKEEEIQKSKDDINKSYEKLKNFNYRELTKDQQELYDIYEDYLEVQKSFEKDDNFAQLFGPLQGIQGYLPTNFIEYTFDSKEEVEKYLKLVKLVPTYIQEALEFTQKQVDNKFFMDDISADKAIKVCSDFTSKVDDNALISSFNNKIDAINMSDAEKKKYKDENKNEVINNIIPAYNNIKTKLEGWKGTRVDQTHGLASYKGGKEYYERLFRDLSGTSKSIKDMEEKLEEAVSENIDIIISNTILSEKDEEYKNYKLEKNDAASIIDNLKKSTNEIVGPIPDVDISVEPIDKSLENDGALAYYVSSRIDNFKFNSIKYNANAGSTDLDFYSTLAHEGYPGHLYQHVYYCNKQVSPLRHTIDYIGYTEGWAKYIETQIIETSGFKDEASIKVANANNNLGYFASALIDMKIHYDNYDQKQISDYLYSLGLNGGAAEEAFNQSMADPGVLIPYALGSYQMQELREKAEDKLGNKFNQIEFHNAVLDAGPSSFVNVEKYVDKYIKDNK
ncbi:MAG: DUF885 family protein [Erysipelotrichaceae bacterium]